MAMPVESGTAPNHDFAEVLSTRLAPDGSVIVKLQPVWDDPLAWGLLLVDLARHAARAYGQLEVCSEALARIRQGFDAEWDNPTDQPRGGLVA
jgi:hypothetical protein